MSRSQIDSPRKAAGIARHGLLADRTRAVGAEVLSGKGVSFRVWAPKRRTVEVVLWREVPQNDWQSAEPLLRRPLEPEAEADGYFSALVPEAAADMSYGFRLDGGSRVFPDPASRFQPRGPTGPSQVIDPRAFGWTDDAWKGITIEGQVLYEMHLGTFTPEGTWRAAQERLPDLIDLGITVVEIMPVAEFPGNFGWGYDGVCLFAPTRHYGRPDDFRRFVDRAHALGLGVILDVVYNHFGTVDCTVSEFSDDYNSRRYENEWGAPVNFDGERSGPVREFFLANVRHWIEEFHLDGFRFDATQSIFDASEVHILTAMQQEAREAAGERGVILLAENEPQDVRLLRPVEEGGHGLDASCNDDFHHTARVRLTGLKEAYYEDYRGSVDELRSCMLGGYLFQGQMYRHQGKRRGTPTRGLPATAFVHFLQNHDQIANTGPGRRIHQLTSPGRLRAMTAALVAVAADSNDLSGTGILRLHAVPLFRRSLRRECCRRWRRGGRSFCRSFRRSTPTKPAARCPIRPAFLPSNAVDSTGASANGTTSGTTCTATCCTSAVTIRSSRGSAPICWRRSHWEGIAWRSATSTNSERPAQTGW